MPLAFENLSANTLREMRKRLWKLYNALHNTADITLLLFSLLHICLCTGLEARWPLRNVNALNKHQSVSA